MKGIVSLALNAMIKVLILLLGKLNPRIRRWNLEVSVVDCVSGVSPRFIRRHFNPRGDGIKTWGLWETNMS